MDNNEAIEWLKTAKYIAEWEKTPFPLEIQIAVDMAIQALKEQSFKNVKEYVTAVKEQAYKDGFEGAKQEIISDLNNICTAGGIWQKPMVEYIKAFKKFVADVDYER